jgi:hypothetical protein
MNFPLAQPKSGVFGSNFLRKKVQNVFNIYFYHLFRFADELLILVRKDLLIDRSRIQVIDGGCLTFKYQQIKS